MSTKILFVEDDETLGSIVQETLNRIGYQVEWLKDSPKAMIMFNKQQPDICILDMMLPSASGIEIASNIRQLSDSIPIIFLTAKTQTQDVLDAFKAGANDYVKKPFSLEELIVRIENLLRFNKSNVAVNTEFGLGQFIFNFSRQLLVSPTKEYELSFKEAEVLRLLASNKNSIVKRDELLKTVWGSNTFFNSRILDVYLSKLRTYLHEDASIQIITIRGVGYKLIY